MIEDKDAQINFWAYLIDNLTPMQLKQAFLIRLGVRAYSLKESRESKGKRE